MAALHHFLGVGVDVQAWDAQKREDEQEIDAHDVVDVGHADVDLRINTERGNAPRGSDTASSAR